jgi:peptide/nickel transport system substrate-binding protein
MHPAFNPDSDYQTFETFQVADDLPVVTMGPWVPVEYRTDEFLVMRRNPYYWKVDEAGNQLPYLNEVTFEKGTDGIGRTLGTLAGSIDHTNLENPQTYVESVTRAQEDDAHFYIEWGPETLLYSLSMNLSTSLGVESERDTALRELFRTFEFRRAIQHLVDGDGLGQTLVRGPFTRAFSGGLAPGSSYYDIDSVVYYPYSPESARALLAELGFEDTDGDGILNWTDGPLAGENLTITIMSSQADAATGTLAEGLVLLGQDVGIQFNHRPLQGPARDDAIDSGTWEMEVDRLEQQFTTPFTRCQELAPITDGAPDWHEKGAEDRELLDFEVELIDIVNQFCLEADFAVRKDLMSQYNHIFTENVYNVGVIVSRFGLALAERFENVPVGTPPFFYEWTWSNVMGEQVWVAPENQLDEVLPGVIAVYDME